MKKLLAFALAAILLVGAVPLTVSAAGNNEPADLPYITSLDYMFINFTTGVDSNAGTADDDAKKSFGAKNSSGAIGSMPDGGALVVSGKAYLSKSYTMPVLSSPLYITSNYGGVDYKNPEPASSPACCMKMASGATFTIKSDVIMDDIIFFQEGAAQTAFVVESGATLVVGKKVINMTKTGKQMQIIVKPGGRAIIGGGNFEVVNEGGEVIEGYIYDYSMVTTIVAPSNDPTEDLPYLTHDAHVYMSFTGSDDASGATAESPKKTFGKANSSGAIGSLPKGGTLVVSGRAYVSASYTMPVLSSTLLITSNYNGVDYKNAEPAENPACAFKMANGATFTLSSDVILDDLIVFQQFEKQTAFVVPGGTTLVVGKNVVNMSLTGKQVKIIVKAGGRAIIGGGNFEIENQGGTVVTDYTYDYRQIKSSDKTLTDAQLALLQNPPKTMYIDYRNGANGNDGTSAQAAKKQLLNLGEKGALTEVAGGGRLVVSGLLYFGIDYTLPKLGSELVITGAHDGENYMDFVNTTNPGGGAMKMATGKTLTIAGDVRLENIILFQEGTTQNTIRVIEGATLTIGENVVCTSKRGEMMKIDVAPGGMVIVEDTTHSFDSISGDGIVILAEAEGSFAATREYDGRFTDVTPDKWFYDFVKTAYEYTLANGTSATEFSPDSQFTVAQALTAATNVHKAYYGNTVRSTVPGEAWYVPYVEYCLQNGIIAVGQFADYNKNIKRGEMAMVFANILPDHEYAAVISGGNPDVTENMACYAAVQKLYQAGIISGDAGTKTYRPNDEIKRSEACVFFTRIAVAEKRIQG